MLAAGLILGSLLVSIVNSAPGIGLAQLSKRQSNITALSATQISFFKPFALFASSAYCDPSTTINWSCSKSSFISLQDWTGDRPSLLCEQQKFALKTRTLFRWHQEATVILCSSVSVTTFLIFVAANKDLTMSFVVKGMSASRHHKERPSSLIKEPRSC